MEYDFGQTVLWFGNNLWIAVKAWAFSWSVSFWITNMDANQEKLASFGVAGRMGHRYTSLFIRDWRASSSQD